VVRPDLGDVGDFVDRQVLRLARLTELFSDRGHGAIYLGFCAAICNLGFSSGC
jgi:hypothetical protein